MRTSAAFFQNTTATPWGSLGENCMGIRGMKVRSSVKKFCDGCRVRFRSLVFSLLGCRVLISVELEWVFPALTFAGKEGGGVENILG